MPFLSTWTQFFPPRPGFTEKDVPDLDGQVYIVTGANSGIGKGLAGLLYARNANVYIGARSESKAEAAIAELKAASPASRGRLTFLPLDLADLSKVKQSADFFLSRERSLHVLWNNAGIMKVAPGEEDAKTAQGHEIHMGTNCLGTFLFTKLLTPVLSETAKTAPPGQVRVVWLSSTIDVAADKNTGLDLDNLDFKTPKPAMLRYGYSKTANYFQAVEYARETRNTDIVSLAVNPGNLSSSLYREHGGLAKLALSAITHAPINGSYTLLYAGLSPEITEDSSGSFVFPFGRLHEPRSDLVLAAKPEEQGGNGTGPRFWQWCEEQVKHFA